MQRNIDLLSNTSYRKKFQLQPQKEFILQTTLPAYKTCSKMSAIEF